MDKFFLISECMAAFDRDLNKLCREVQFIQLSVVCIVAL